jgi:CheY-like chemotaxis protein
LIDIKPAALKPMPSSMNAQTVPESTVQHLTASIVDFPRREAMPLNLTVYLAENDPGSRSALSSALEAIGCRAISFSTGIEAIEEAAEETPDVLLIDARLPDTDALEALAGLKGDSATRAIPVVVLATSLLRDEEAPCLDAGAHAFLTKPVSIDSLFTVLASIARRQAV